MDCEACNYNSKACDRVRNLNGLLGSMDCDKTPEKIRWAVNTHTVQSWAIQRFRVLIDMLIARVEHPEDYKNSTPEYFKEEMAKINAKLKEQYDKEPRP